MEGMGFQGIRKRKTGDFRRVSISRFTKWFIIKEE